MELHGIYPNGYLRVCKTLIVCLRVYVHVFVCACVFFCHTIIRKKFFKNYIIRVLILLIEDYEISYGEVRTEVIIRCVFFVCTCFFSFTYICK